MKNITIATLKGQLGICPNEMMITLFRIYCLVTFGNLSLVTTLILMEKITSYSVN